MAVSEDENSLHELTGSEHSLQQSNFPWQKSLQQRLVVSAEDLTDHRRNTSSSRIIDGDIHFLPTITTKLNAVHLTGGSGSLEEEKSWKSMDSVHSRGSITSSNTGGGAASMLDDIAGNNSLVDFDDSCCSFASFGGGSDSSMDSTSALELAAKRAAFKRLTEEPTPRQLLLKTQSMRLKRGASYRGTLTLIQESKSSSLD